MAQANSARIVSLHWDRLTALALNLCLWLALLPVAQEILG